MKAISLTSPWAWAILHAGKRIENRCWSSSHRGRVGLHAAKGMTQEDYESAEFFMRSIPGCPPLPDFHDLPRGAMVGSIEIVDCVKASDSPWFQGPYGFVLRNPICLRAPVPCKGALNFWDIPEDVQAKCIETGITLDTIIYSDLDGHEIFREPMIFKRLWAVGQDLIHEGKTYYVTEMETKENIQRVTITDSRPQVGPLDDSLWLRAPRLRA